LGVTSRARVYAEDIPFDLLMRRHWHHVAVEVGGDPIRAGDDQEDNQHAERQGEDIVGVVRPAAEMQKNTKCMPIWAMASTMSPTGTPGGQSRSVCDTTKQPIVAAVA
jgi:hypothetical protein